MLRTKSASGPAEQASRRPVVEVSWGELIDKVTILELKARRLSSPAALDNVRRELSVLTGTLGGLQAPDALDDLKRRLASVNETLWDIEDEIRAKEAAGAFDGDFVHLARSVYINNDLRSALKREINLLLNSDIIEEKQYTDYGHGAPAPARSRRVPADAAAQ